MKHRTEPDGIEAVLLAGPTASGKSALALGLAERFAGTIVNADSMQVYRDLSVITARPGEADLARAPHRLYGHVDGAVNHSAGLWREEAAGLLSQGGLRLPIFTGGTGLYFRALEQGLAAMPAVPETVRAAIRGEAEGAETPLLHARLAAIDPMMAARLRPSDRQRILRALEVMAATGRSLADWQGAPHTLPLVSRRHALRVFLAPDREALKRRIDARFEAMVRDGALEEVERLAGRGLDPALPVMRAHGVLWLIAHLRGEIGIGEAIERAKADTRRYARRQFTWFRHQMPGWLFLPPEEAAEGLRAALDAGAAPRPAVVSD